MKTDRRNFIKMAGVAGTGMLATTMIAGKKEDIPLSSTIKTGTKKYKQRFNMCGFAAPKINTVRIGFIGLGRGLTHVLMTSLLEGVDIKALCDIVPEKVNRAKKRLEGTAFTPQIYTSDAEAWKKMCDRDDIDIIYIATPWYMHVSMAVYAMEHDKHVAIEVPAAITIEECWQLVETSERTRKHCMMLENSCYSPFELLTLNMARQGFFGDIVHCEGAYLHSVVDLTLSKAVWDLWRLKAFIGPSGNLYPTHGLGPICQVMDINRGDKMDFLVSVNSKDFQMNKRAKELALTDEIYKEYVDKPFNGNINTSTIRTSKGRTILVQFDITSPNVYSRIHKISGTKAAALGYPLPAKISIADKWITPEELSSLENKYEHPIIKKVGELAKGVGGHGGSDFLLNWRLIDCLHNGLPLDQDCYDAALWSSITPLSKQSVSNRSNSVDIPDFTGGSWTTNQPVDILLKEGGTTKVLK